MGDWRLDVHVEGAPDKMTEHERIALGILMEQGRSVADRTIERVTETGARDPVDIRRALEQLQEAGYVEHDVDAKLGVEFWWATAKAADLDFD